MRNFLVVWFGQFVSSIGSGMSAFAFALWMYEQTGQATTLALVAVSAAIPRIILMFISGIIIDRYSRKRMIMLCDSVAALVTVVFLILYTGATLEMSAIYLGVAVISIFDTLQGVAYDAATSVMVKPEQYARAEGLMTLKWYGSNLLAWPAAAVLYPILGLGGIMIVDLVTFLIAVTLTGITPIRQPARTRTAVDSASSVVRRIAADLAFGFQFIRRDKALRLLLIVNVLFIFGTSATEVLYTPMIMARTGVDPNALAWWFVAAGIGGGLSSLIISLGRGPKRMVRAYGLASMLAGIGKTLVGLSQTILGWMGAQVITSFMYPFRQSAQMTMWRNATEAGSQGRVFATRAAIAEFVGLFALMISAPLADNVFGPALRPGGPLAQSLGWLVGTGPGAGLSLTIILFTPLMILSGVLALTLPGLRVLNKPTASVVAAAETETQEPAVEPVAEPAVATAGD